MDRQCRGSKGKAKIEGYMRVSDEEAHHHCIRQLGIKMWVGISINILKVSICDIAFPKCELIKVDS